MCIDSQCWWNTVRLTMAGVCKSQREIRKTSVVSVILQLHARLHVPARGAILLLLSPAFRLSLFTRKITFVGRYHWISCAPESQQKKKYIFWKPLLYSVRSIICNSKRTPKFYLRRKLDLELGGCSIVLISNTKGKIYVRFKSGEEKSREMTTSTFVLCYKRQEQHRNMPKPLTETKSWHRNQRPDNISHLRYTFPSL